ncbi:hypothetical protein cypCar_00035692 [Cyprinus carpio]|nr:hypothetical protein cypCar_00035692 [Cyprinus carpio]
MGRDCHHLLRGGRRNGILALLASRFSGASSALPLHIFQNPELRTTEPQISFNTQLNPSPGASSSAPRDPTSCGPDRTPPTSNSIPLVYHFPFSPSINTFTSCHRYETTQGSCARDPVCLKLMLRPQESQGYLCARVCPYALLQSGYMGLLLLVLCSAHSSVATYAGTDPGVLPRTKRTRSGTLGSRVRRTYEDIATACCTTHLALTNRAGGERTRRWCELVMTWHLYLVVKGSERGRCSWSGSLLLPPSIMALWRACIFSSIMGLTGKRDRGGL